MHETPLLAVARELLGHYGESSLVEELNAWETVRATASATPYEAPADQNARTLITLDGIPGAGKSTAQRRLQPALGAGYFSMARFAEARGVTADDRRQHQLATGQPHPVDEAFIAALLESPSRFVLLEKFPRSVIESTALLNAVRKHGWRFEVLHLQLPGDCVASSTQRQIDRGPRHGRMPEPDYARHRALVHLARATSGRETLRAHGVPIHAFDMTRPEAENEAAIVRALGLDAEALPWHRRPLEILARVAKDAWVASGSVYRPFWNGRFGPAQLPTDVDVAVGREADVQPLLEALQKESPEERWSVLCPSTRLRERYGIETSNATEAKRFATFMHRTGLVRLRDEKIELQLPEGAEACLRNGVIALNPVLLERLDETRRAEVLLRETHHLPRALGDYPGLQIEPRTSALLGGSPHWRDHRPRVVVTGWHALKTLALAPPNASALAGFASPTASAPAHPEPVEGPPQLKAIAFCRRALGTEEQHIALEILRFHQASDFSPQAPPLPRRGAVPADLSGLHQFSREADDAVFGEWFLDQVHHHQPVGGADQYLRSVLDFTLFGRAMKALRREQSPMHQGWLLEKHLAQSVLQLQTDALLVRLSSTHDREWLLDLRLCMRLAMLFHDTGKLLGPKPRRHALISAGLFGRFKPPWFPQRRVELTQWLIRTHDLFGSFGRGLTEKEGVSVGDYGVDLSLATSYFGALDSQAVRSVLLESGLPLTEATAINKALWCADVGSIAALRWLLPVADLVERLLSVPIRSR